MPDGDEIALAQEDVGFAESNVAADELGGLYDDE